MNPLLRYGLVAGLAICVLMFAPYFLFDLDPRWMRISEVVGYTCMVLCLSATWFAMQHAQRQRGPLRYGSALAIGAGVSTVAALVFGLATWGFCAFVGDPLPEALMAYYQMQVRDSGATPEQVALRLQELEAMRPLLYNHPLQGAVMGATVFIIGVIESLIGAAWVTRRAPRAATA